MKDYKIIHDEKVLYCRLPGKNKVLSTSVLNGGIHESIQLVYNLDCKPAEGKEIHLEGGKYESHLAWYAKEKLETPSQYATGYLTAAQMENAAIAEMRYMEEHRADEENTDGSFSVKAVVTGGIDKNGSRVAEDAYWHENAGIWHQTKDGQWYENAGIRHQAEDGPEQNPGTINIMLFISANLTDGALTRALVTCTEAKTAAIQELCLPSLYSEGLATGSGTDGTIIVSDMDSPLLLTEAGKHTKLGELIGKCVKKAVKEALIRQTQVEAKNRRNIFCFLGRFGCTREKLVEQVKKSGISEELIDKWASNMVSVSWAHMEAHLLDLYHWEMFSLEEYEDSHRRLKDAYFPSKETNIMTILEKVHQLSK